MAGKKNSELFDVSLDGEAGDSTAKRAEVPPTGGRRDYLGKRETALAKITSGDLVNKTLHKVDPARCRLWKHHNRRYNLLNENRCQDLIEGIKAQGGQEFPAIVRPVKDDPNYDYEIICGARRHWVISWLRARHYDYKFLIEVRDLTDEEAFRLSDIENRDREDISDYERAVDYKNALGLYYSSAQEMADRLDANKAWLSRFLDLANMPEVVLSAYPDITHVKERHYRDLKPLLKGAQKTTILDRAKGLAKEQAERRERGEPLLDGTGVIKALKDAVRAPKTRKDPMATFTCPTSKKPMLEVNRNGKHGFVLKLHSASGASKEELTAAFTEVLEKYYEG